MVKAKLIRVFQLDDRTFGVFIFNDLLLWVTLELGWKNNAHEISCIPTGTYICKRINSPKHGNTFEVTGVPNRTNIEIHGANLPEDLLGCIGIAKMYGDFGAKGIGVANPFKSAAMQEFLRRTNGINEFELTIEEHFHV